MANQRAKTDVELDAREAAVLRSVIEQHVLSGEPVGSQTVARVGKLGVSPASIRNTMARLEERGLLTQPHTSAGRVPTDAGYRHYVNQTIGCGPQVEASVALSIDEALAGARSEIPELLGQASRQLSTITNQVGLALAPEMQRIVVRKLEFVRLAAHRVMAIIVGASGVVHHRVLDIHGAPEPVELERIGRYLTTEFGGRTIPAMRRLLEQRMTEERAKYDRLQAKSLELGQQALDAEVAESDLFVEGASNLFQSPEFADLDIIRALMQTLEEKATLIDLLTRLLDGDGVQVVIGAENPVSDLSRCSVVAANYRSGGRVVGTVAIVGPTRMEYPRVISLVEHLGKVLTRMFSAPGN